jgi:hypothetical protein
MYQQQSFVPTQFTSALSTEIYSPFFKGATVLQPFNSFYISSPAACPCQGPAPISQIPQIPQIPPQTQLSSDPKIWGQNLWKYLHTCANFYPEHPTEEDKMEMISWIRALRVTLPCKTCRVHYSKYIEKLSLGELQQIVKSNKTLVKFFVDLHNHVNKRYNKTLISYDQACDMYDSQVCTSCNSSDVYKIDN